MRAILIFGVIFGILAALAVAYPADSIEQEQAENEKELINVNNDGLQAETSARKTRQFFGGGYGGYGGYGGFGGYRGFGFRRFGGFGGYGGYGGFGGGFGGFGGGYGGYYG